MTETRGCRNYWNREVWFSCVVANWNVSVSSVNFEDTVRVDNKVKKGDMLGYFLFGGSDFVLLFQSKVDFELTVPQAINSTYKHVWWAKNTVDLE